MSSPTSAPRHLTSGYVARFGEAKARLQLAEEALSQGHGGALLCDHHLTIALAQIRIMRQWLGQGLNQEQTQ